MAEPQPGSNKKSTRKKRVLTPEHKAAMSQGRRAGQAVQAYLSIIEKTDGSSKEDLDKLHERARTLEQAIKNASPVQRLKYTQELLNLNAKIRAVRVQDDPQEREEAFVAILPEYSEKNGISRAAWKAVGVPDRVLDEALGKRGPGRPRKELQDA